MNAFREVEKSVHRGEPATREAEKKRVQRCVAAMELKPDFDALRPAAHFERSAVTWTDPFGQTKMWRSRPPRVTAMVRCLKVAGPDRI